MSTAEDFRPHYTVDEYRQWEGDWELWNGMPVAMTPSPFGPHSRLLVDVSFALKTAINAAKCDATVLAEIDWIVHEHTVLRPDISVVCGREPERHLGTAPAIVVEILSDSTRVRDTGHKRTIYRDEKVPFYWMVDPANSSHTILQLVDAEYQELSFVNSLRIRICNECELNLDLSELVG